MSACHVCAGTAVETVLDLGRQPVSSHFTQEPRMPVVLHELALGVCHDCGVMVLIKPWPYQDLVPPFDWVTYREPEAHLDALVDRLRSASGITEGSVVVGLTYKDRTTLERLQRLGFTHTRLIDPRRDLGALDRNANIETVHGLLTPERAGALAREQGEADVLIVRHILEHAESAHRFLDALCRLVKPGGHVVIEVPEVSGNLARQDYTMIWEEHNSYFLPELMGGVMARAGLEVLAIDRTAYPFEDVIVVHARRTSLSGSSNASPNTDAGDVRSAVERARNYGRAFAGWSDRYRRLCEQETRDGRKLAAYGAGHLTSAFLNFHELAEHFAFVIDDTPYKQGLHLPLSGLPIVPRDRLTPGQIALCLFGFTPEIEAKVAAANLAYTSAGGRFASMFVDSPTSIRALMGS